MPFTPFHFGPAVAIKAAIPSQFSFAIFCYSQVVTDLESGFYLFRGEYPVHRFFHTYLGASLVGLVCALTGRFGYQLSMRVWQAWFPPRLNGSSRGSVSMSWRVAFVSALVGTYSHVFLDSIMHRDITPWSPFTNANPMLDIVNVSLLHLLCLALGLVGTLILPFRVNRDDPPA